MPQMTEKKALKKIQLAAKDATINFSVFSKKTSRSIEYSKFRTRPKNDIFKSHKGKAKF